MENYKLSPLQQLVLARIQALEEKIEQHYGLKMCCGIEMEFYYRTSGEDKRYSLEKELPLPSELKCKFHYVSGSTDKYEISTGPDNAKTLGECVSPKTTATHSHQLKHYFKHMVNQLGPHQEAKFAPIDKALNKATAGIHVNLSLWDKAYNSNRTENFCSVNANRMRYLEAQAALFPLFIESEALLERFSRGQNVPKNFSFGYDEKRGTSLNLRISGHAVKDRLEDRLAGADTDPIFATLVAVGAVYHALSSKTKYTDMYMQPIPNTLQAYGSTLKTSEENIIAKEILGPELFKAIWPFQQQRYASMIKPQLPEGKVAYAGILNHSQKSADVKISKPNFERK